jgi:hypothetical protein
MMLGMPMLEMPLWSRVAAIVRYASVTGLNGAQPIGAEFGTTARGFIHQPVARMPAPFRWSRESGEPGDYATAPARSGWIPAFAGMSGGKRRFLAMRDIGGGVFT